MIKVTPANLEAIVRRITEAAARGKDMTPLMRRISGILGSGIERNFAPGGRPQWQDLAESTKRSRARKGKWPGQILIVSSQLVNSIQEFFSGTVAGAGTNKIYAAIQNFGGTISQHPRSELFVRNRVTKGKNKGRFARGTKPGKGVTTGSRTITIPARPFAQITDQEVREIEVATMEFLVGQ